MTMLNETIVVSALRYAAAGAAALYVLNQVRRPDKWGGRLFLWIMNRTHSGVTDWGLEHVRIEKDFTVLDVGCGGGRTIEKLAALATEGKVYGVDYAKGSLAASRAKNAALVQAGRVEIKQASVSQLPFPADQFDLVTAVETHYYWPDLVKDMQEILRVLKPGGTLVLIAESYKKGKRNRPPQPSKRAAIFQRLTVDEHQTLFVNAGYTDVETFEERSRGWFCGTGKKPR